MADGTPPILDPEQRRQMALRLAGAVAASQQQQQPAVPSPAVDPAQQLYEQRRQALTGERTTAEAATKGPSLKERLSWMIPRYGRREEADYEQRQRGASQRLSDIIREQGSLEQARMGELGAAGRTQMQEDAAMRRQVEARQNRVLTPPEQFMGGDPTLMDRYRQMKQAEQDVKPDVLGERVREFDVREQRMRDTEASREAMRRDLAGQQLALQRERLAASLDPNKPTMMSRNMQQVAAMALPHLDVIRNEIDQARNYIGPGAGRWNEAMTGSIGFADPSANHVFMKLRGDVGMLQTNIMLAHARGRMSNVLFEHFEKLFNMINQDPDNALAQLDVAQEWLTAYATLQGVGGQPQRPPLGNFVK